MKIHYPQSRSSRARPMLQTVPLYTPLIHPNVKRGNKVIVIVPSLLFPFIIIIEPYYYETIVSRAAGKPVYIPLRPIIYNPL